MRSSCCCTPAGVWQTGVATSSTDCMSSELIRGSSSWPATAASTVSMCWTRSYVSPSRSMYSSSTPSVYGSLAPNLWSSTLTSPSPKPPLPLPVIEVGKSCLSDICLHLDLDEPPRIEQLDDDAGARRPGLSEHLTVGP